MVPESSLFLKKISPNKYEILTKDLDIEQGSYSIQNIDGLWIMKKTTGSQGVFTNNDIHSKGFFIFEDGNSATKFAYGIREDIEQEKVKGIKGFNNKFYFFSTNYYINQKNRIMPLLSTPQTLTQLSEKMEISDEVVKGLLELLKEDGLIFEKTKEVFYKI